ncbi:MAG: SAM-dependent methyltransferase [Solirubrobacterales bacterium]
MSDNLVRDVHDAVAGSDSPVEASVRPPGTTSRELRTMWRDVLRKLRLRPGVSVAEIGCGVGLLGVPVAESSARYLGLDFAPQAVRVANERLRAAEVVNRARVLCVDVLAVSGGELEALGRFDRVLVYAVLHYARSEREAVRFLQLTVDLLAPGGRALVGNVPLDDLQVDWTAPEPAPQGLIARVIAAARWVTRPGTAPVPLTRRWKVRRIVETMSRSRAPAERFAPARLPPNYTLPLTTAAVERWLTSLEGNLTHHWELPAPGAPLAAGRADLIIERSR